MDSTPPFAEHALITLIIRDVHQKKGVERLNSNGIWMNMGKPAGEGG